MLRVMNVLLMQFVITRAIHGCLRTQTLLVKHRHIGPAMMYEPTGLKALVILWEENKENCQAAVDVEQECGLNQAALAVQIGGLA